MDSQWYYEDHGRAKGPVSTADLVTKIQKGQLRLLDLVFKEGNGEWHPIETFAEITDLLKNSVSVQKDADWIVLRVVEVDGKEKYEQIGPYNAEQVLELVDRGRIKFNDFVWKTGFETWVPLGKIDKFDKPLASSVEVDISLYKMPHFIDTPAESAPIKNYNPIRKAPELKEEKPPQGAAGPDLAQPQWALNLKKQKVEPLQETKPREAVDLGEPSEIRPPTQDKKSSQLSPQLDTQVRKSAVDFVTGVFNRINKAETPEPKNENLEIRGSRLSRIEETVTAIPETKSPPVSVIITKTAKKEQALENNVEKQQTKKSSDKNKTSDNVVALPASEDIEKMQLRWRKLVSGLAVLAVVSGTGLFGYWIKNHFSSKSTNIVFEKPNNTQFKLIPPSPEAAPSVVPSAQETAQLPSPDSGVPPAVEAQKQAVGRPPAGALKLLPGGEKKVVESKEPELDVAAMSTKQKSFFHQSERMFVFYNSQKGIKLTNDLVSLSRKKYKTPNQWKSVYGNWLTAHKNFEKGISRERAKARLHGGLFKSLAAATDRLESRGREFNVQKVSGRGPTKALNADDILSDFKKINTKAKSLDQ